MKATKIKMKSGCAYSQSLLEIDSIYIEGCKSPGFYEKATIYNYLRDNPGSIVVNIYPFPKLIPAMSKYGEKYVRSTANQYEHDNLLDLPRV